MDFEVKEAQAKIPATKDSGYLRPQEPVFIGRSPCVKELLSKVGIVANSQVPILITGESGTGKEVVARLIHHRSGDQNKPFVAINSAALPKDVVDNELFGHEKEAFTGAVSKKAGCFELAHHGTLFLDEIAEMHPQTQAKLLRAIENKSFRRLGGREEVAVNARIIAATNRDVQKALKSGEFREDLYYRLNVIELALTPLRERPDDIDLLIDHFNETLSEQYGKKSKQFTPEALMMLRSFEWPGNVRELRNVLERLILVCPDDEISPDHLPTHISRQCTAQSSIHIPIGTSIKEAEQLLVRRTLASVKNNKSAAARILGLTRKTIRKKLSR